MYEAKILADSVSPAGVRLTTLQATYPLVVHAHLLTHRALSRNTASSRAIPVEKRIAAVRADPFIPSSFGKNQPGMVATAELEAAGQVEARRIWLSACYAACGRAADLAALGVHKQLANRLIEPFAWVTAIISATEWANFYALRCHPDAQPEIRQAAELMRAAMAVSAPQPLHLGSWHIPLVTREERMSAANRGIDWRKVSAGRCARVSYLGIEKERHPSEDVALCDRLIAGGHMSPVEHVATPHGQPRDRQRFEGNFRGWKQLRKTLTGESVFTPPT